MNSARFDLMELIGSRICHDLISPIGAISNGVELISMGGAADGPELSLISQSVDSANARIRYFRIAFGAARPGQLIGRSEIVDILRENYGSARMVIDWQPEGEKERQQVKLAFLLLMCFESAMPWGGRVDVSSVGQQWAIKGQAEQMKIDPQYWGILGDRSIENPGDAAHVHFALAAMQADAIGCTLQIEHSNNSLRVRF